jgi:hypothetical protein
MHTHAKGVVWSLFVLALGLAVGPGCPNLAYSQPPPYYGGDWRDGEEREQQRYREERRQEEYQDDYYNNNREHRRRECNNAWNGCMTQCNFLPNANYRFACVANCNNFLHECNQRR